MQRDNRVKVSALLLAEHKVSHEAGRNRLAGSIKYIVNRLAGSRKYKTYFLGKKNRYRQSIFL